MKWGEENEKERDNKGRSEILESKERRKKNIKGKKRRREKGNERKTRNTWMVCLMKSKRLANRWTSNENGRGDQMESWRKD